MAKIIIEFEDVEHMLNGMKDIQIFLNIISVETSLMSLYGIVNDKSINNSIEALKMVSGVTRIRMA